LEEAQDLALRYGITSLGEMFTPPDFLDDLRAFHESGELRVRVSPYLIYNTNCGERMGEWYLDPDIAFADSGDDMLRVDGVKIFADGGSCRGVALSFELEEGGGYGDLFITEDELISVMRNAQDSGFQVAVHALGDRALDVVLDAFGAVPDPQTPVRHRIEHNAVIRPEQLPRYSEVDLVATIRGLYPSCSPFGPPLPEPYRAWEWRTNSLIQSNPGLHVAWHSDYPYHSLIPMDHLFGFVTRYDVGKFGQTCPPPDYLASDTLPVEDALKIMTIEGAYALRREEQVGSLQPGKFADVVILSADPRSVPTMEIKKVDVLMTMVGGQVEWCAKGYEHLCPEGSSSD
jgi:predicted amidohydrolase YtcJ